MSLLLRAESGRDRRVRVTGCFQIFHEPKRYTSAGSCVGGITVYEGDCG